MTPAASLAAVLFLALSPLPARAQSIGSQPDPFVAAISREAARLGSVGSTQAIGDLRRGPRGPADPGWSRVQNVAPGTELKLETRALRSATRYFLQADEDGLTVVSLDDSSLDGSAKHALIQLARTQPNALIAVTHGSTAAYGIVRVTPGGVFVSGERQTYLPAVLQTIPRAEVLEIKVPPTGHATRNGALIGLAVGEALALGGVLSCHGGCGDEGGRAPAFVFLSIFLGGPGAGIGAGVGALVGATEKSDVIYRLP